LLFLAPSKGFLSIKGYSHTHTVSAKTEAEGSAERERRNPILCKEKKSEKKSDNLKRKNNFKN